MSRWIVILLIAGWLAACGQPTSTPLAATSPVSTQPTATAPASLPPTPAAPTGVAATGTPIRVDLTPTQRAGPFVSIALRAPDNSIKIVDTQVPVAVPPLHVTTGFLPQGGVISGTVYALDFTAQPQAVAVDQTGTHPLNFVHNPSYGLAVSPHLAWATPPRAPINHRNCSTVTLRGRS